MNRLKAAVLAIVFVLPGTPIGSSFAEDTTLIVERAPDAIDEPMHSQVLINSMIRVYEATIPGNSSTLFHRHTLSGVGIDMTPNRLAIEKIGASRSEETTKSGDFFPVRAVVPYVHRISNLDSVPYRVLVAERLGSTPLGRGSSSLMDVAGVKLEVETELVRAFRLVVRPGEWTPPHTVGANTLVVALSGGLVSVETTGKELAMHAVSPGQSSWVAEAISTRVFNAGVVEYSVAYLEWK